MLNWVGGAGVDTLVRIWFINQGKGVIELFDANGSGTPLASAQDSVSYLIPARKEPFDLAITTAASRPPGADIFLMMEASQNGVTLAAFEGTNPANGNPHGPAAFADPVPNGSMGRFDAMVAFP